MSNCFVLQQRLLVFVPFTRYGKLQSHSTAIQTKFYKNLLVFLFFFFTLDVERSPSGGKRPAGRRILFRGYQGCDSVPAKGWWHRAGPNEEVGGLDGTSKRPRRQIGSTLNSWVARQRQCHLVAETWRSHARPPSCCLHGKVLRTLLIFYYRRRFHLPLKMYR